MKILRWFKNFDRWVAKVVQYAIFLWNDTDYDWAFSLRLLKYKLGRIRKHIIKHNIIVEAEKIGKDIQYAEDLIDRIMADKYCNDEMDAFWKRADKEWNRNLTEQEQAEFHSICLKSDEMREKDWNELWEYLRLNLRNWWD